MTETSTFALAVTFFLVANPIGNTPAIIALIKDFNFAHQEKILIREWLFSLALALWFQYFGEYFLNALKIDDYAVMITGGLLLLLVAINMIFVKDKSETVSQRKQEPFFVPIATPILSGPGLLAIIMMKSKLETHNIKVTIAIVIAWIGVLAILSVAPYLQRFLGKRGLIALEQVMGMILSLVSVNMIVKGSELFMDSLS